MLESTKNSSETEKSKTCRFHPSKMCSLIFREYTNLQAANSMKCFILYKNVFAFFAVVRFMPLHFKHLLAFRFANKLSHILNGRAENLIFHTRNAYLHSICNSFEPNNYPLFDSMRNCNRFMHFNYNSNKPLPRKLRFFI